MSSFIKTVEVQIGGRYDNALVAFDLAVSCILGRKALGKEEYHERHRFVLIDFEFVVTIMLVLNQGVQNLVH